MVNLEPFQIRETLTPFRGLMAEVNGAEAEAAGMDASRRVCRLYMLPGNGLRQWQTVMRLRDGRIFRLLGPAAEPPRGSAKVYAVALCEEVTDA
ncbi:MAG: hypothetical protein IKP40_08420 [Clostridia bacterium]|nr:hypothetical protein [Clostridia bacterium]